MDLLKYRSNQAFFDLIQKVSEIKSVEQAKIHLFSQIKRSSQLDKALAFCLKYHSGQYRKSGEEYAVHPILVSSIVAYMGGSENMVISAILHDVVEDTSCDISVIREEFGEDVERLVEGLTKIVNIRENKLSPSSSQEKLKSSADSFRKMLLISIQDVRVLVIKLCDRVHNMLTIDALREEKRKRIAGETLMVYAPIAHRLGMSAIKNILEDLSFKNVLPNEYNKINTYIKQQSQTLQLKLNSFSQKVKDLMLANGFFEEDFLVQNRVKHYYSIYLKMQRKGISLEEVLDLLAIRIIVKEAKDCYLVLGLVHQNFNPLISRFKDYIALPKQNGYQTIHTTIFDEQNIIEVQIRTFDMQKTAEFGVAAHWKYKNSFIVNPKLDWLSDLNKEEKSDNSVEFYEYAKDNLYVEDIAVYSPKGEIFTLPRGSTALDYAYEIHTEIGLYAKEAYLNKTKVSLLTKLKNGDIVSIVTGSEPEFRCSWLENLKTGKAKDAVKTFCKNQLKEINYKVAISILTTIFLNTTNKIKAYLRKENIKDVEKVANDSNYLLEVVNQIKKYQNEFFAFNKYQVKKQKLDNVVVYSNIKINEAIFDYCCNPKRGDDIMAFLKNHTAIVHHKLCKKAEKMITSQNMLFVKWTKNTPRRYNLILSLENKRGSLFALFRDLLKLKIDVIHINLKEDKEAASDFFEMTIELEEDLKIESVIEALKKKYKIIEFVSVDDAYKK